VTHDLKAARGTGPLLAITGVSHIALLVNDLEASTRWYERVVGLREVSSAPGRYAQMAPESNAFRLGLVETPEPLGQGMFGHLAIALESMEVLHGWVEHLDALGVEHTPIKENPFNAGVFSIDVFDPDGHEIELIFEP
jgi:catechol 2,3-dioxygenase-like lactoylglutathione lyase family enzyme